jgi:hypothetical protein
MNWNNTQFDGAAPVTLRAAQQVKEVLRFCDAATVILGGQGKTGHLSTLQNRPFPVSGIEAD